MDIYLVKNLRMLFCQLIISALIYQKDLFDFGKVFVEFITSSETPVSTRSRSPKYQEKETMLPRRKNSLSNSLNYIFGSRQLRPPYTDFSIF